MDAFDTHSNTLVAPIRDAAAVTPSDSTDLPHLPRALWVGSGGSLSVVTAGGQTVRFDGVPNGTMLPVRAARVRASGTNAGAILALW